VHVCEKKFSQHKECSWWNAPFFIYADMINVNDKLIREELPKIGVDAFAVLMCITSHINRQNKAWPGIDRLRTMTGLSKERTYKALKTLVEMGHIERRQDNKRGEFGRIVYRLTTQYLGVYMGVSSFELPADEPLAGKPEHGYPEHGKPEHGKAACLSINEGEVINKDEVINEGENPPAQFHVQLHSLETIEPPTNEGSALAESWRPAADHMIKHIEATPGALQYNLKGARPLPANWRESVRERMRHFQAQGEWFKITVPSNLSGKRRRWEAEMCAAIAKWIDSPYNTQPGAQNNTPAPPVRASFTLPTKGQ
jgi:DNA-binding MarR family transcriptional regulator